MDCAQICGFGHTMMKALVIVESREAYESWVRQKAGSAQATSTENGGK